MFAPCTVCCQKGSSCSSLYICSFCLRSKCILQLEERQFSAAVFDIVHKNCSFRGPTGSNGRRAFLILDCREIWCSFMLWVIPEAGKMLFKFRCEQRAKQKSEHRLPGRRICLAVTQGRMSNCQQSDTLSPTLFMVRRWSYRKSYVLFYGYSTQDSRLWFPVGSHLSEIPQVSQLWMCTQT